MSITLKSGSTTLPLYEGMQWVDEYAWSSVAMVMEYSTDGTPLVDFGNRKAGRPITLQTAQAASWADVRQNVEIFKAWAARAGEKFVLRLRGRDYEVMFNHTSSPGFEAELMGELFDSEVTDDTEYRITFRFIEV